MSTAQELRRVLALVEELQEGLEKERVLWADAILKGQAKLAVERTSHAETRAALTEAHKLLWGVVHGAGRPPSRTEGHRWAFVRDATGTGSTSAARLCRQHGLDPDEMVGEPPEADEGADQ